MVRDVQLPNPPSPARFPSSFKPHDPLSSLFRLAGNAPGQPAPQRRQILGERSDNVDSPLIITPKVLSRSGKTATSRQLVSSAMTSRLSAELAHGRIRVSPAPRPALSKASEMEASIVMSFGEDESMLMQTDAPDVSESWELDDDDEAPQWSHQRRSSEHSTVSRALDGSRPDVD